MNVPSATADLLAETLTNEGGVRGTFYGEDVLLHFGDWRAEYAALGNRAGVVSLAPRTQLEVTGADRAAFLNRLATNQLDNLPPWHGCETFLCNAKGHILAHLLVFVRPDSLVLDTAAGQAETLGGHFAHYQIRDDVTVADRSPAWHEFLLAGPAVPGMLRELIADGIPQDRLAHRDAMVAASPVSLRCIEPSGPARFLISCPKESAAQVWNALRQCEARACGRMAFEPFRIECGWPEYGRDITPENLPQEVGRIDRSISFTKGCYLGQETVARIASRGHVNRTLAGLKFACSEAPPAATELIAEGQPIGRLTSVAHSPRFGSAIALGYVRRSHATPGTRLDSVAGPVEVVALPM
ncbi:MAG: YgfZ/GcvT domain-containing protein [Thermoguttaceae bacterium]